MDASGIGKLPRWLIAFTAVCLFLMHLPVLVLIAFSFNASKFAVTWTGFTLGWYRRLLERDDILHAPDGDAVGHVDELADRPVGDGLGERDQPTPVDAERAIVVGDGPERVLESGPVAQRHHQRQAGQEHDHAHGRGDGG